MTGNNTNPESEERAIDLMVEQHEIVNQVQDSYEKLRGLGRKWNRFRGNTTSNIVFHYLQKHLPSDVKLVKLAWVHGCATEFDILVVDKDAKPIGLTDAYPKNKVRLLIEIKASGVFYKRENVRKTMFDMFKKWKEETGKPTVYLSTWEAKAHIKEVQNALGIDMAFSLRVEGEDMVWGEWERFLDRVNDLL